MSQGRSDVPHVVVDSGAAANGGLPISEEIIGQAHARAEVAQRVVLNDGAERKWVSEVVDLPGFPVIQLVRRVHEFIAQAQVYGQPLRYPPVVLAIESISVVDKIPVFSGKGRSKLYLEWVAQQEIRELIVNDLPIKGVGCLTGFIEPVEEYAKLEGMLATDPVHIVAQSVDVLSGKRRRGGVHGTELGIIAAAGPAQVDYSSIKARHELGTSSTGQADVSLVDRVVGAAEGKARGIEYCRRENVILRQRNPLISRGHACSGSKSSPLRLILKGIVNGIASKEGVLVGNCLVETHLPVILSERVMVIESLNGRIAGTAGRTLTLGRAEVRAPTKQQCRD